MRSKCLEESSGGVKKEISAFSSTPKLSFIWLTRLSAMKALRDPCVHTTLLSPFRRVSQDVLIKQAAKSFTPYCCNLLSSYICVLLIRVTSLRYNSGSKYQYVVLTQRCAPPQTRFLRIRKVRTKGRLSREWRNLRCHFGEHDGHYQYRLHYKQIYSFYPIDIFVSDSFKTTEWRA